MYKAPEADEHISDIAGAMIHYKDPTKALKESYTCQVFDEVNIEKIKKVLSFMDIDQCKIGICGFEIL